MKPFRLTVCECSDKQCPEVQGAHGGFAECRNSATVVLYRVDMNDESGVRFCDACASDALDSGVFATAGTDDEYESKP